MPLPKVVQNDPTEGQPSARGCARSLYASQCTTEWVSLNPKRSNLPWWQCYWSLRTTIKPAPTVRYSPAWGNKKKSNRRQINAPPIANSPAASAGNVSLAAYAHTGCSASESQIQSQMVILLEDRTKLLSCRVCVSVGSSTGRCRSPTPLYLPVFAQITCCHSSSSVMQRGGMFASVPFQPSYLSLHAHLPARFFLHPAQRLTMWEDTVLTLS